MQELVDYREYRLSRMEELKCLGVAVLLAAVAAWILYKSLWGLMFCVVIFPVYRRNYRNRKTEERKRELLSQFKDGMQSVSVALLSGYSIENSWQEAERELLELYGAKAYMTTELHRMNGAIRMNQSVEQLLYQFALRTGCEDIVGFAEVFRFAKRSGGNMGRIIQNTIHRVADKQEVEREIATVLSGKKMEQKIMNIVPVCLLAYLNLTSEEFLAPLYGNLFGVCVMTVAFLAYIGALLLAQKMVTIRI